MKGFSWKNLTSGQFSWKDFAAENFSRENLEKAQGSLKKMAGRQFSWRKVNVAVSVPVPGMVRVRQSQAYKFGFALFIGLLAAVVILLAGLAENLKESIIWHRSLVGFGGTAILVYLLEFLLDRFGIPLFVNRNEDMQSVWTSDAYDDEYLWGKYLAPGGSDAETPAEETPAEEEADLIIAEADSASEPDDASSGANAAEPAAADVPAQPAEEQSETDSEIEALLAQVEAERLADESVERQAETAPPPDPEELRQIARAAAEAAAADAAAEEKKQSDAQPGFQAFTPQNFEQVKADGK